MISMKILGLDRFNAHMAQRRARLLPFLNQVMLKQMLSLADYIRESKLSGQVLKNRTGTLRRGIHGASDISESNVKGIVSAANTGPDGGYARIHEFGGTFTIPEHTRTITQAFGRPITPVEALVRAHTATYPERAFMRPSVQEKRQQIMDSIVAGVRTVLHE